MPRGCRSVRISIAKKILSHSPSYSCVALRRGSRAFPMRVLFCNKYNYPFSGTEVYLFELMELLRAKSHEVALFSMADPRGEPTAYDGHFVPHIDFKAKSGWWQKARQAGH